MQIKIQQNLVHVQCLPHRFGQSAGVDHRAQAVGQMVRRRSRNPNNSRCRGGIIFTFRWEAAAEAASERRTLLLVMAIGGLWHGASFNFLVWGLYHG